MTSRQGRRPAPWSAGLLVVLTAVAAVEASVTTPWPAVLIGPGVILLVAAALAAGAWSGPMPATAAVLVGAVLMTVASQAADPGRYAVADDLVFSLVVLGCPAVIGAGLANRDRQFRELKRLSLIRLGQVEAQVEAARISETNRIASAVQHDIVQTLSAVIVRAEGALPAEPGWRRPNGDPAGAALVEIEEAARTALDHLRGHIGVLRSSPQSAATDPEPIPSEAGRPPAARLPALGRPDLLAGLAALPIGVEVALTDLAFGPAWVAAIAPLCLAPPLAIRRRHPLLAAAGLFAIATVISLLLVPLGGLVTSILPMLLIGHAVGAQLTSWRPRLAGLGIVAAGAVAVAWAPPAQVDAGDVAATLVALVLAVLAGVVSAAGDARVRAQDDLITAIERHRGDEVALAAARQRQAVARDLHDSVASAATIICLQASAAQTLLPDRHAEVREVLETIADTARGAVREVRASLDLVARTDVDGSAGGDLAAVVDAARRAGLDVDLDMTVALPEGTGELAARIVREGLVNASRHAPGAHVGVSVTTEREAVTVRVVNDGAAHAAPSTVTGTGTGTGLVGLTERLTAGGGSLSHGTLPGGGYELRAMLPVPTTATLA